ncbi:MAG: hypothetical protein ACPG4N_11995 [Gammaproteobacteria bacterium]
MAGLIVGVLGMVGLSAGAQPISDDFWLAPRNGRAVLEEPTIRANLQRWLDNPGSRIVVRYPGGEEGLLWANDLRDWLVASGVESSAIVLLAGSGGGSVVMEVETNARLGQ